MRYLPRPTDMDGVLLDAGEVFETCVSMVRNPALKAQLRSIRPEVETEANDYHVKASDARLFQKEPHEHVGTVSGDDMVKVYTRRMAPRTSRGRPIYDRILSAPVHRRCPFCGIGTVNTLDHYLPKDKFPVYSVTPDNLVPACQWCQTEKGEYYAKEAGEQLLHPYYDNMDEEIWLAAEVVPGAPAGFRYFASPPNFWEQTIKDRLDTHLIALSLLELFSSNAGSRLAEIRARLTNLMLSGGEDAVRAHLQEELDSIEAEHKNSWSAAMYRAALADEWFCSGGFMET